MFRLIFVIIPRSSAAVGCAVVTFDYQGIFLELWQLIFIASFSFSLLFTIAFYYLINQSITYVLKIFVVSLIITSILYAGIGIILSISPELLLVILIAIGLIVLKKHAALNDALNDAIKAFAVSFTTNTLVFGVLISIILVILYSSSGLSINIDEIDAPVGENITYIEITNKEMEKYPAVGKAINSYLETNEHYIEIEDKDQTQVTDFFEKKTRESAYLFSIKDAGLEEDLNKNIITDELKNIFENNGFTISENIYANTHINQISEIRWDIVERDESTYEILKEEGRLNVYDAESIYNRDTIFRFGELYFKVNFICGH